MLSTVAKDRTDLTAGDIEHLQRLVGEWSLIADLALSDLVLWLPTWNDGGLVAAALVRPTTAPTSVPEDLVGTFAPRGRYPHLDRALALGRVDGEAYPVRHEDRVVAVVARLSSQQPRVAGRLEEVYLRTAADLFEMLVDGGFPPAQAETELSDAPRVGDGLMRIDQAGTVEYASPNAVSALHRLGLATDVVGINLRDTVIRLSHRHVPMDEALLRVAGGSAAGSCDVENAVATVVLHGIPLTREGVRHAGLVLVRDVTEVRRRERALLSKDATIREIHHRVKNNLQTVAALLRLQARRAGSDETRSALSEAELRVAAIALVHDALASDPGGTVHFDDIVERLIHLVRDLAPAYADAGAVPTITRTGTCGLLPSEVATPLAMALAEVLQNAVEHSGATRITVDFGRDGSLVTIAVGDDGRGLPESFSLATAGLGLQIVESLITSQLRGNFRLETGPSGGVRAEFAIPAGVGSAS